MAARSQDTEDEAAIDARLFDDDVSVESGGVPAPEPGTPEGLSEPGEWLRGQRDRASQRSAELQIESAAVQSQSGQAIQSARRLRNRIAQDRELALGLRWFAGFNDRDAEALVGIADEAITVHPSRLFGAQASYYGHAGLRTWVAEIAGNPSVSRVLISPGDVRRERSGAILVLGELVLRRRSVTPVSALLLVRERAITTVHYFLSDEATLKHTGHAGP
jgi:hypothetical protein